MTCGIYKITNNYNKMSYIGKSIHIEQKWKEHLAGKGSKNLFKDLQEYGKENFSFEILEECSKEELNQKEIKWIAFYNTYNNGYNEDKGGDNNIQAIKATQKTIYCYDLEGNFITSYISLSEAERHTNIPNANISKAARGLRKKAGDYQWRYEKIDKIEPYSRKFTMPPHSHEHMKKSVKQYDLDGNFIAEYSSITEASKKTGANQKSIGMNCNKQRKTAGGFIWKFSNKKEE